MNTLTRTAPEVIDLNMTAGEQTAWLIDGDAYWISLTAHGLAFEKELTRQTHTVGVVRGRATGCSCNDHKWRRRACKHMQAAPIAFAKLW